MTTTTRALVASLALLALVGCSAPAGVEPGEGPAATEDYVPPDITPSADPLPPPEVASFADQVVYKDGVAVEVIRIRQTTLSETGAADETKPGDPVTVLTIRIKNGSGKALDTTGAGTLSYGPDGMEASEAYDTGIESADGKILPGKAKTGTYGWVIPKRYLSDVTLEFLWDNELIHDPAIFSGSVE